MAGSRRAGRTIGALGAGVALGAVETVLAVAFAALVFNGLVGDSIADGIAVFGVAAGVAIGAFALLAGRRGTLAGLAGVSAAVVAVVTTTTALGSFGGPDRAFLTVLLTTSVVSLLVGLACLLLGARRRANLLRFVPYPVAGGVLAGAGWLLIRGAIGVAVSEPPSLLPLGDLLPGEELVRWVPAVALGVVLLVAARIVRRPITIPLVLAIGLAAFAVGMIVTGSTVAEARSFGWLVLGPFDEPHVWEPWAARAITGADRAAVLWETLGVIAAAVVSVVAVARAADDAVAATGRPEVDRDLRDVGVANVIAATLGGFPVSPSVDGTSLAARWRLGGRATGLVAAAVPIVAVAVAAPTLALLPRIVLGGMLAYLGLALLVGWLWDRRRSLSRVEYVVVVLILLTVAARGFLPGVVVALVMSVVLFAVSYGRVESLRTVAFGDTFRSNVDRPAGERDALRGMRAEVEIVQVDGFMFFGSTNALLERVRARVAAGPMRSLVLDMRRVTGVDASAVASFDKIVQMATAGGFELVVAGARDAVRRQLARRGIAGSDGVVAFEPDLERALERCEETLLGATDTTSPSDGASGPPMPDGVDAYLEREAIDAGEVLIRQGEAPDDVFVLESGVLRVEMRTTEGETMRLRTIRPGVMVGEIAMYTGARRTADVVAESPSVVLRLTRSALERMQLEQPALAVAVHRWLAGALAERLTDTQRVVETLVT